MTELLYQTDSYIREFSARVVTEEDGALAAVAFGPCSGYLQYRELHCSARGRFLRKRNLDRVRDAVDPGELGSLA